MRNLWMAAFLITTAFAMADVSVKTLTFKAADGLTITADLYQAHPATAPLIVCFHQARSSRGEYAKIAPRLNKLGFNVLAVDQRSGGSFDSIINLTAREAKSKGKPSSYLDALPDMHAAVAYARRNPAKGKLLIWGSSYSASLVLKMAGDDPALADGVLSFSPGEYFAPPESAVFIERSARGITVPVFITSAQSEKSDWDRIQTAILSKNKTVFLPTAEGNHGSSALLRDSAEEYWKAVEVFLKPFLNR